MNRRIVVSTPVPATLPLAATRTQLLGRLVPLIPAHRSHELAERLSAGGVRGIDRLSIASGLRRAVWPGRLEIIPGRPDLLLDGAHNPAGYAALAAYLKDHQRNRSIVLLFASMKDKPAGSMHDLLCPMARKVIVTRVLVPRGEAPEALARDTVGTHGLVVISGSLYLVGEVKKSLPNGAPG